MTHFRGSELQLYFKKVLEDKLKSTTKPQYVDQIPKAISGKVGEIMNTKNERGAAEGIMKELEIDHLVERSKGLVE